MRSGTRQTDRGLLATVRELQHVRSAAPHTAAVAAAVGVPDEYARFIEQRLEENEERGYVERDAAGRWTLTSTGTTVAASRWATLAAAGS
jgi:Mn-dependent DtxR family transcriptional regulator